MLAHIGLIITGFIGPLIIWAVYKDRSPMIRQNAANALNFGILATIGMFVSGLLMLVAVGYVIAMVIWVLMIVFGVMGAMAASRGEVYRYPINIDMVK
jgi:uncharacterized protein